MAFRAKMSLNAFLPTKTCFCVRSASGVRRHAVNASIAWVSASAPAIAVSEGGHVQLRTGSEIAATGIS
jgi:hypothetical protein